jgi:hypothetical protein
MVFRGLDHGVKGYVARWSDGSTELVKDTAERVVGCAKKILTALDISEPLAEVS